MTATWVSSAGALRFVCNFWRAEKRDIYFRTFEFPFGLSGAASTINLTFHKSLQSPENRISILPFGECIICYSKSLEISYLAFPSITISLKARELRAPPAIRTVPPIQATNSAGPKLYLQRQTSRCGFSLGTLWTLPNTQHFTYFSRRCPSINPHPIQHVSSVYFIIATAGENPGTSHDLTGIDRSSCNTQNTWEKTWQTH